MIKKHIYALLKYKLSLHLLEHLSSKMSSQYLGHDPWKYMAQTQSQASLGMSSWQSVLSDLLLEATVMSPGQFLHDHMVNC